MSTRAARIAGYGLIAIVLAAFTLAAVATVMEFSGLSKKLYRSARTEDTRPLRLHKTDYYGAILGSDPYKPFAVQHLHPYYLFSLPWRPEDIAAANNAYVKVNDNGFRDSGVTDAEAKDARHLVVLQPSFDFFSEETKASHLRRRVYELGMSDPWCSDRCLDLSRIPALERPTLYDGSNAKTAGVDAVYLSDIGVEAALQAIVPFIASAR